MRVAAPLCGALLTVTSDSPAQSRRTQSREAVTLTVTPTDTLVLDLSSARVWITADELDSLDFADSIFADSAKIVQLGFGNLEGAKVQVRVAPGQTINASAQFGFAYLQYLTDDRPAPSLQFRYRTGWVDLVTNGATFRLPTYRNPEDGAPDLSTLLGYADRRAMDSAFGQRFLPRVRRESLALQATFYDQLLRDSTVARCCPEYLVQARQFLSKRPADFLTTNDLGLELYHHDTLLRIQILSGHGVTAILLLAIGGEDL